MSSIVRNPLTHHGTWLYCAVSQYAPHEVSCPISLAIETINLENLFSRVVGITKQQILPFPNNDADQCS